MTTGLCATTGSSCCSSRYSGLNSCDCVKNRHARRDFDGVLRALEIAFPFLLLQEFLGNSLGAGLVSNFFLGVAGLVIWMLLVGMDHRALARS